MTATILAPFFTPVFAESPGTYSRRSDFVFRPLPDRDGYTQAYSVNFRGNGFRIYTVFLVSNIGPKSLNNGVAVLIYHKGQSRVFTSEQDYRTLKAKPGELDLHSGPHRLSLSGGGPPFGKQDRLKLFVTSPQFQLELDFTNLQRGVRLSGGPVRVSDEPSDFVRADIPIVHANARGKMLFQGERYDLRGVGGMDSIYTNVSPHKYAKRFSLTRSYNPANGFFLGVIQGDGAFPGNFQARFAWLQSGAVKSCGVVNKIEVLRSRVDPLSGYKLPVKTQYLARTDPGEECRITETVQRPAGGYSVLASISGFLRWILSVFFARPYILHFETEIVFACRESPEGEYLERSRFSNVQNSHYMINE
ncbi:MAG: hypothetical protein NXI24_02025 [bacterium]|nr:hypothetical protein [bacterium]